MLQRLLLPARGVVIADRLVFAASPAQRMRGLLGSDELSPGTGLVLATRQVHTFGMRYPIDVVFCDRDWVVLHVVREMRPNRVTRVVLRARRVVELAAGSAGSVEVGDRLTVEPTEDRG